MINPRTIRTISDLRENPLEVLKSAEKLGEPIYLFYRSRPKGVVLDLEKFNTLMELVEDYMDALKIKEVLEDKDSQFVDFEKFWNQHGFAKK